MCQGCSNRGDSSLQVQMHNGCGVFEGRPEAVLFAWNPMGEVAQYPEQTPNNWLHNNSTTTDYL